MEDQSSCAPDFNVNDVNLKGFKVYELSSRKSAIPTYNRRDYYKICIVSGKQIINYADKGFEVDGTVLFFGNPHIPYSWEFLSDKERSGYACVFTEEFLKPERSESLQQSPLFKIGGTPLLMLDKEQVKFITTLFKKMLDEQSTEYIYKADLMRNYINLIIHEALKMQPVETVFQHKNASARITSFFLELLERQFPIDSLEHPLKLKTAKDFAENLSVHVNHLNRAVKEITGKPTTVHISERIVTEAKALLQHTDWNIADIAYGLGFEYPTHFNNYFKRITGATPKAFRS